MGVVVGQHGLAEQGLGDRRGEEAGRPLEFVACAERAAAGQDDDPFGAVEQGRGGLQIVFGGKAAPFEPAVRHMARPVALRAPGFREILFLDIIGDREMRDAAPAERRSAGKARDALHMRRVGDLHVEHRQIVEHARQVDILLREGLDEVVILHARDGEHRGLVELGIIKPGEKMRAAGAGGGEADAEAAGPLGIGRGHEGRRLLMAHLDEADAVLPRPERLHDAVDAVSGQAEDELDAPLDERLDEDVR